MVYNAPMDTITEDVLDIHEARLQALEEEVKKLLFYINLESVLPNKLAERDAFKSAHHKDI